MLRLAIEVVHHDNGAAKVTDLLSSRLPVSVVNGGRERASKVAMNSAEAARERQPTKLDVQLGLIVSAFEEKGIGVGAARFPDDSLDFLYEKGVILVRDAYLDQVAAFLRGPGTASSSEAAVEGRFPTGVLPGVTLYPLAGTRFPDVLEA